MNATVDDLLTDALKLTEDDRIELAEALLASIDHEREVRLDDELLALIEKREAELDSGAVVPIPWEEVKRRVRGITGE